MKKILLLAALFAASVAFVGCSKDKDDKDDGTAKCWKIVTKIKVMGMSSETGYYFWGTATEANAEVKKEKENNISGPGVSSSVSKKKADKSEDSCSGIF